MLKTLLSAIRRATLIGVSAAVLALVASIFAAPAASAYVAPFVPVISPGSSASVPAQQTSNFRFLEDEHVVNWSSYEVTGEHEITFTVWTGTPSCYDVRAEVAESNGTLQVATVEGTVKDAPDMCTMEARAAQVKVYTNAPASSLNVQQLPASQVTLND